MEINIWIPNLIREEKGECDWLGSSALNSDLFWERLAPNCISRCSRIPSDAQSPVNLLSHFKPSLRYTAFLIPLHFNRHFFCCVSLYLLCSVVVRPADNRFLAATSHPRADPCHQLLQQSMA